MLNRYLKNSNLNMGFYDIDYSALKQPEERKSIPTSVYISVFVILAISSVIVLSIYLINKSTLKKPSYK